MAPTVHLSGPVDRIAAALGVPRCVREVSCVIYRRALTDDHIRAQSIEVVATVTLYAG